MTEIKPYGVGPTRWRKRPVEIEAMQLTDDNSAHAIYWWIIESGRGCVVPTNPTRVEVLTLEGTMTADKGDWIIKGIQGEFYPCKDDIFRATYDLVES